MQQPHRNPQQCTAIKCAWAYLHCCKPPRKLGLKSLFHVAAGCLTISGSDARPFASRPCEWVMHSFSASAQGFQTLAEHRGCVGRVETPGVNTREGQDSLLVAVRREFLCLMFQLQTTAQYSPGPLLTRMPCPALFWHFAELKLYLRYRDAKRASIS